MSSKDDFSICLKKVFWVYGFALALIALSFHARAADESAKGENKVEVKTTKADEKTDKKDKKTDKKEKEMIATFETNQGTFKVKLFPDKAPKTVENFVGLAEGTKEFTNP